jgi:hypothetical protein
MYHHKAERCERYSAVAVLDLHVPHDALPMPASGRFRLRLPRFLYQQGQGSLLLPPRFECLAHSTGTRD